MEQERLIRVLVAAGVDGLSNGGDAIADVGDRRGNFMGTWDQVLCNALRHEYDADIALSAGVRWGTSTLEGDWITMEDVMTQCSMTYGETYMNEMKGQDLMNVLEQVADNLFDPDPYLQSGGDMVRVGGLDFTIDPTKTYQTQERPGQHA